MKTTVSYFILCLYFLALSSCGIAKISDVRPDLKYSFSLINVKLSEDTKSTEYAVNVNQEGLFFFEDNYIRIAWDPTNNGFSFNLLNKNPLSIQIIWDNAVWIDIDNTVGRLLHKGVAYIDRNKSQPPITIPSGSEINDFFIPTKNITYATDGWDNREILPTIPKRVRCRKDFSDITTIVVYEADPAYVGKTTSVLLPIQMQGTLREYLFTFMIDTVSNK